MRLEYEAIVAAGFMLQIDSPDLGARPLHALQGTQSRGRTSDSRTWHVEVLNEALRNCPADRLRLHVCWGNYEGPHHHDVPMEVVLPIALTAKPQALLFEAANPRHAHEWTVFRERDHPATTRSWCRVLIDSVHELHRAPELVAQRIRALCRHRRSGAGDRRHRLRVLDLRRLRQRSMPISSTPSSELSPRARARPAGGSGHEHAIAHLPRSGNARRPGERLLGTFIKTPHPAGRSKCSAPPRLDCLCIDAEHAPFGAWRA
jgi:hypothetical protein